MQDAAKRYLAAGICALPASRAGKSPYPIKWREFQTRRPGERELANLFGENKTHDAVCILTGAISGGLEMLDFDRKGAAYELWREKVMALPGGPELLERIPVERSQSGGYHLYWKCPALIPSATEAPAAGKQKKKEFPGNMVFAEYKPTADEAAEYIRAEAAKGGKQGETARKKVEAGDGYKALIETRGEGGLSICAPSEGYTPVHGSLEAIPTITPEERELLLGEAYSFDEKPLDLLSIVQAKRTRKPGDRLRPGDDYSSREDVTEKAVELLTEFGWMECGKSKCKGADCTQFTRPGKSSGASASLFSNGAFHVFSTSADPFEGGKSYSPFEVYALLKHGGDFSAAAEALRKEGYGEDERSGGRPKIPVDDMALDFLARNYTVDGFLTLRRYHGVWYQYRAEAGRWQELKDDDLKSYITAYIQAVGQTTSTNLVSNILRSLDSATLCALPGDIYEMPCWIESRGQAENLLPMKNGILDVEAAAQETQENLGLRVPLLPLTPDLFTTFGLGYEFDPEAKCPKFEKYLQEVQPEEGDRKSLQMLAGLSLVPDCRYNVAFFLYGPGGTGKSVFLSILGSLVGSENCACVSLAMLTNRFGLAPLTEKLLNLVPELPVSPENRNMQGMEGLFKSITSGDPIPVERKGKDVYAARAIARMVFATNVLPHFNDRSSGIWDRLRIIPFLREIRGTKKQNNNLAAELRGELPGILNWALRGLAELRRHTVFPECPGGKEMKEEHRRMCDHERDFLLENTAAEADFSTSVSSDFLYQRYKDWMQATKSGYPVSQKKFCDAVKRVYPKSEKRQISQGEGRCLAFVGIRLTAENPGFIEVV